jgi:hypothetical protein
MKDPVAWKRNLALQLARLLPGVDIPDEDWYRIVLELEAAKAIQRPQYSEAQELWDAIEPGPKDQIVEAVIVAKLVDFERGITSISMSATDGVDWVGQLGMLHGALKIMNQSPLERKDEDD